MHTIVIQLETREGSYKIGCLLPNALNAAPVPARLATPRSAADMAAWKGTYRPWVVLAIDIDYRAPETDEDGDALSEPIPTAYHVVAMPLQGADSVHAGQPLIVDLRAQDVSRAYRTGDAREVYEYGLQLLQPPAPEPEARDKTEEEEEEEGGPMAFSEPSAPAAPAPPAAAPQSAMMVPTTAAGESHAAP